MKSKASLGSLALLVGICASCSVFAQTVVQAASVTLQPQISRDENGFSACGVRTVVLDAKPGLMDAYDFSLVIRAEGMMAVLKAGKASTTNENAMKGKLSTEAIKPGPIGFWITKESEGKSLKMEHIIPADTSGYILGSADMPMTLSTILAITKGERMQFATRYKKDRTDTIVAFGVKMPENERAPLWDCLDALGTRMESSLKKK